MISVKMAKILSKKWWKNHWDEALLISCIIGSIYFMLKANGYFV